MTCFNATLRFYILNNWPTYGQNKARFKLETKLPRDHNSHNADDPCTDVSIFLCWQVIPLYTSTTATYSNHNTLMLLHSSREWNISVMCLSQVVWIQANTHKQMYIKPQTREKTHKDSCTHSCPTVLIYQTRQAGTSGWSSPDEFYINSCLQQQCLSSGHSYQEDN